MIKCNCKKLPSSGYLKADSCNIVMYQIFFAKLEQLPHFCGVIVTMLVGWLVFQTMPSAKKACSVMVDLSKLVEF